MDVVPGAVSAHKVLYGVTLAFLFICFIVVNIKSSEYKQLFKAQQFNSRQEPIEKSSPAPASTTEHQVVRKCKRHERMEYVRTQCERHMGGFHFDALLNKELDKELRWKVYKGIRVDDSKQLLVCFQAKTGCTTFKTLLVRHSDVYKNSSSPPEKPHVHSKKTLRHYNITLLTDYSEDKIIQKLRTYTKLITVRNPLVRVFSAYRNKLASRTPPACHMYQKGLGRKVLLEARGVLNKQQEKCGWDATFAEFMAYYARDPEHRVQKDNHWKSFVKTCHPCYIKYDHIFKLETGHSDELEFVNRYLHGNARSVYIRNNESTLDETSVARNNYEQTYAQFADVNASDIKTIKNVYRAESLLFGYTSVVTKAGLVNKCKATVNNQLCC